MSTGKLKVGGIALNLCIAQSIRLYSKCFKVYFACKNDACVVLNFIIVNYEETHFLSENWVRGKAK